MHRTNKTAGVATPQELLSDTKHWSHQRHQPSYIPGELLSLSWWANHLPHQVCWRTGLLKRRRGRQHQIGTHLPEWGKNYCDIMVATEVLKAGLSAAHVLGQRKSISEVPSCFSLPRLVLTGTTRHFLLVFILFFSTYSKYARNQRFWKTKFLANSGWSELIVSARGGKKKKERKRKEWEGNSEKISKHIVSTSSKQNGLGFFWNTKMFHFNIFTFVSQNSLFVLQTNIN